MAESPTTTRRSIPGAARRLKYGSSMSFVAALLALALAVLVNWIGYRNFYRHDFTAAGMYSLSPQTRNVLDSLQDKYQLSSPSSAPAAPRLARANDLTDEYARRSTKITVDHLDPTVDIDHLEKLYSGLRDRYGDKDQTNRSSPWRMARRRS